MTGSVRMRLAIMMFLEYAVWGVWAPILAVYLGRLPAFQEDTATKINMVYLTMAIASIVSPFIAGQLADRYFSTEKYLAFSHLVGGALLLWASQVTTFWPLFLIMLAHCTLYAPTVPLTNSLSFHHLPNPEKDFGPTRLWGTIGWIVIGWIFSGWLGLPEGVTKVLPHPPSVGNCLIFGGVLSFLMAAFCLTLPHTPPSSHPQSAWAFVEALKLCRKPSFAVMLVVAFIVSTELQFYYVLTPNFFADRTGQSLSTPQLEAAVGEKKEAESFLSKLVRPYLDLFRGKPEGEKDPTEVQIQFLAILLDTNRNNKLSKEEVDGYDERVKELQVVSGGIKEDNKEYTLREIQKEVEDSGLGQEKPPELSLVNTVIRWVGFANEDKQLVPWTAERIASHAIRVADSDGNGTLNRKEIDLAVNQAVAEAGMAEKAAQGFAKYATEKGGVNRSDETVPRVMSYGQFAEILVLLLLPVSLTYLGFTWTIALGIAAWAVRYYVFSLGHPTWAVIASQTLHGFGFGFFFVGCMIYCDRVAPRDVRASAQSLFIVVTFGVGMLLSSLIAGPVADYFQFNWHKIFLVPVGILAACTVIFLIGFRAEPPQEEVKPDLPPPDTAPASGGEGIQSAPGVTGIQDR
jgi:MFS family permease